MKPSVSIFTPSHDSSFLPQVYDSIKDQPFDEWHVVYNNGGEPVPFDDPRYKPHLLYKAPEWVGPLKRLACELCTGDVLLELDHDDLLLPGAVEAVKEAFSDPSVGFTYSNAVRCTGDFKPADRFLDGFGWEWRPYTHGEEVLDEIVSFGPTPANVSRIWYAPDHLRAFRRDVYERAGGYRDDMRVLDDLDLMCRLYSETEFKHIDRPLYLYRIHGENAWLKHNQEIQDNVYRIYDQHIERMALMWSKRQGLLELDLGGRLDPQDGYTCVDLHSADVNADLNERWPFPDNSVGVVRAYDLFEHLTDPLHTMKELYRVLAPGGYAFIQVPSTDGRGAFQDPTHRSWWNENSFHYYAGNKAYWIDSPVRFQALRLYTTEKNSEQVCWVRAHLMKIADGMRVAGPVLV